MIHLVNCFEGGLEMDNKKHSTQVVTRKKDAEKAPRPSSELASNVWWWKAKEEGQNSYFILFFYVFVIGLHY